MTKYDPLLSLRQAVRSIQDDMENMGKLHEKIQQLPVTIEGPATSPIIKDSPGPDEILELLRSLAIIDKWVATSPKKRFIILEIEDGTSAWQADAYYYTGPMGHWANVTGLGDTIQDAIANLSLLLDE